MQYIDIVIIGFLIYGVIRGIWDGLFVALASFVSLLLGIYLALKFSNVLQSILSDHVDWSPQTTQIVAFAVTFVLVVVGITILAKVFTKLASFASLGWINKIAGGFFGLLKTILILSIILNLFEKINLNHTFISKEILEKSICYTPIMELSQSIYPTIESWISEVKIAD